MTRPLIEVEAELADVRERIRLLKARDTDLRAERDRARVAEAETAPHPWIGRKVKRWVKTYPWQASRTQRGIVQTAGATVVYGPRGYRPAPGESYVISASGRTRYRLQLRADSITGPWELDE